MAYIDLNMVRAGVVKHPSEWQFSGFKEILNPPQRYALLDRTFLKELYGATTEKLFQTTYKQITERVLDDHCMRDPQCSESIAVGGRLYLEEIKEGLGSRGIHRNVIEKGGQYLLREPQKPYNALFDGKNEVLSLQNTYYWK